MGPGAEDNGRNQSQRRGMRPGAGQGLGSDQRRDRTRSKAGERQE